MFIVLRPIRCKMKLQKVASKPQHCFEIVVSLWWPLLWIFWQPAISPCILSQHKTPRTLKTCCLFILMQPSFHTFENRIFGECVIQAIFFESAVCNRCKFSRGSGLTFIILASLKCMCSVEKTLPSSRWREIRSIPNVLHLATFGKETSQLRSPVYWQKEEHCSNNVLVLKSTCLLWSSKCRFSLLTPLCTWTACASSCFYWVIETQSYINQRTYCFGLFSNNNKYISCTRQEGWRLEPEDLSNPDSPMIFKGVVFNEMKGAMVSLFSKIKS